MAHSAAQARLQNGKEEGPRAKDCPARQEAAGADHPGQVYADPWGAHTSPQVQVGRSHRVAGCRRLGRGPGQTRGPGQAEDPASRGYEQTRRPGQVQTGLITQPVPPARNPVRGPSRALTQRGGPNQEPRPGGRRDGAARNLRTTSPAGAAPARAQVVFGPKICPGFCRRPGA